MIESAQAFRSGESFQSTQEVTEAVVAALNTVVDPCGLFNGSMTTIGELGMYRGITVSADTLEIEVFLDDPNCAFSGQILHDIHTAVDPIAGGRSVELSMVVDDYWDEDRITPTGNLKLEQSREARRRMLPLRVVPAHSA